MQSNDKYKVVMQAPKNTVVAQYTPEKIRSEHYQSEQELEESFIEELKSQKYEYLPIKTEEDLIKNLRVQLEKLNEFKFTDNEWNRFFKHEISKENAGIKEKTETIQQDQIKSLELDSGERKNIYLLKTKTIDVHDNVLQIINQYSTDKGQRPNRYDVTILVNGLPLVHVELKRRGVMLQEAFNQISRYNRESFWADSGLFEYIQLFVISNGTHTKYYSNTVRKQHTDEKNKKKKSVKKSSHSFEFTSWWTDANNNRIPDLMDFAKTFFSKHSLLNIITKYCVFTSKKQLLVMRPYQIVATEKIINRIVVSTNNSQLGSLEAGGYVWHTTGSGKTLTSFKTALLTSQLPSIDKVIFVVDRKDLDHQTMEEYNKFQEGAANSNISTKILKEQLGDSKSKIIVTTIQKLSIFIKTNKNHEVFKKHMVLIFDECHRSQFGEMHKEITTQFKKYHLFGFTGTPIFAKNASSGNAPNLKTTKQAFGDKLHVYTIVNAISDNNVLPFKVDYLKTFSGSGNIKDKKVQSIDHESALKSPERLEKIVEYIIENFDRKTKRNSHYKFKGRRLAGFNSIFAVSSIDAAKRYYFEFKEQLNNKPESSRLKIALIYSFGVNEDIDGILGDESLEDTSKLDKSSRDFLEDAIKDYNKMFNVSFDTSSDKFQNYYTNLSKRVKGRELDILIVVNMFLTGFDATTLNTLWVDKNLRLHGLLQAYSRTNRILNTVKSFGNIVCFRDLEEATNQSIALFGDKKASGIVLLRSYSDYYNGYEDDSGKPERGYKDLVDELLERFPVDQLIIKEGDKRDFIKLYGLFLKLRNILETFDEFVENEILSARDLQDYRSKYLDLYHEFRKDTQGEKENINDDLVFEIELIKQTEINIDYIISLIEKYHKSNTKDKTVDLDNIKKSIDASMELRSKKDLIMDFITRLNPQSIVDTEWEEFVEERKVKELEVIIENENLNKEATYKFIENAFKDGYISDSGIAITEVMQQSTSRFSEGGKYDEKKHHIIEKLRKFFERFFNISKNQFIQE